MTAATFQMVVIGLQALTAEAPNLIASIKTALGKDTITPEDWDALRAQVTADTYEQLVPSSKLTSADFETPPADPAPPQAS